MNKVKIFKQAGSNTPIKGTDGAAAHDMYANLLLTWDTLPSNNKYYVPEESTTGVINEYISHETEINCVKAIILNPLERILIKTGIHIGLNITDHVQVVPRSGLALKYGITILNSPGIIDQDFKGGIGVLLVNLSNNPVMIVDNERIAQMQLIKTEDIEFEEVETIEQLGISDRDSAGYGTTGNK